MVVVLVAVQRGLSHRDVDLFYHRPVIGSKRRRRGVEVLSLDATTQQSGAFFGERERERWRETERWRE